MITLNVYTSLNEVTAYIDDHIEEKIEYERLAQILGVNVYTFQKVFSLLTNISLSEYIRKRRLSLAGYDLYTGNEKVMEVAIKYQYENATSFSRAFETFHGIKPSAVKKGNYSLKDFPRTVFSEPNIEKENISYQIISLKEFSLYGKGIKTSEGKISQDAPRFSEEMQSTYCGVYGAISYGMVVYENRFFSKNLEYWVLWEKRIEEFQKIVIPASKWLVFRVSSRSSKEIQKVIHNFYDKFLKSSKFNLKKIPELEYYHDAVTDFMVPIE